MYVYLMFNGDASGNHVGSLTILYLFKNSFRELPAFIVCTKQEKYVTFYIISIILYLNFCIYTYLVNVHVFYNLFT